MELELFLFNFFNWSVLIEGWPILQRGLFLTLLLIVTIVPSAFALGLVIATLQYVAPRWLRILIFIYIDFVRSLPPLVLIIFVFFAFPFIGIRLGEFTAVYLAVVINGGAFFGEIFRAGFESVPRGQVEAARSTGHSSVESVLMVVLPQGLRNVLPAAATNAVELMKATSLASVVALPELLRSARILMGITYNPTPLIAVAVMYLILLLPMVRLVSRFEHRARAQNGE